MNEPTKAQKMQLASITRIFYPNFMHFYQDVGIVYLLGGLGEPKHIVGKFDSWQSLAEYLKGELAKWYAENFAKLIYIELGMGTDIELEPAKIYAADGVFDSQDDMNRHCAARASDLFGDHELMNQDDSETDGY